jgi:5-methylcytosine-specific restriction endonuclease McrA
MTHSKPCTKCGQIKSLDEFHKDKSRKDLRRSFCKICTNLANKKWNTANRDYAKAYYQANKEHIKAKVKLWYSENRDTAAAYSKAWAKANPDKVAAANRRWCRANAKKVAARSKAWSQANLEKERFTSAKRRATQLENGVFTVTLKELKRLYARPCAYCGAISKHIDHVIPLSRGGTHSIGNMVGACASCNLSKSVKFITEWKKP